MDGELTNEGAAFAVINMQKIVSFLFFDYYTVFLEIKPPVVVFFNYPRGIGSI